MKSVLSKDGLIELWNAIKNKFVEKETGKGLSTNDFTNTYKKKLDGLVNVDLSKYVKTSDIVELTNDEIDEICS